VSHDTPYLKVTSFVRKLTPERETDYRAGIDSERLSMRAGVQPYLITARAAGPYVLSLARMHVRYGKPHAPDGVL
jgi:hypothetical protein